MQGDVWARFSKKKNELFHTNALALTLFLGSWTRCGYYFYLYCILRTGVERNATEVPLGKVLVCQVSAAGIWEPAPWPSLQPAWKAWEEILTVVQGRGWLYLQLIDRSLRTSVRLKNAWHSLPVSADVSVVVRVCVFPEHPTEMSLLKDSSLVLGGVTPRVKEQL